MANNRKSIQEKRMSGTYRKDRDEGKEDVEWGKLTEIPCAPDYFSEYARELWQTYCKELLERTDLCLVYLPALEQFCYSCDIAQRAATELNVTMVTKSQANPAVHPAFRIWKEATKTITEIGAQFGFSPKSKANIPGAEKVEQLSSLFK